MILSPDRRTHNHSLPVVATASGLGKYVFKHLGLGAKLDAVKDGRDAGRITFESGTVLRTLVFGLLLGIGSMRGIEDRLRRGNELLFWAGLSRGFSDDTARDVVTQLKSGGLERALSELGTFALYRWGAGRYLESELAQRLRPVGASHAVARAVVAIDGHESFCSEKLRCDDCQTRVKTVKRGGKLVEVEEHYHQLVVAQQVGSHPAVVLDVERVRPGEGEVTAAYRLVKRLGATYGKVIGTLVADAAYDHGPFRSACQAAGFWSVVRHKDEKRRPGADLKKQLEARHPLLRSRPDGWHRDTHNGNLYEYWVESEAPYTRWFYVEVRRTKPDGSVMTGSLVTDLPLETMSPLAAGLIMEARWWLENTGFHELAGQFHFDRAFVHAGKPTGAWAMVLLTLLAYNVWQLYLYRHLGLDPKKPCRTWGALRIDLLVSLRDLLAPKRPLARSRPP